MKHPSSASGAARTISRILRENGFEKSKRRNSSEGYYVWSFGNSVHVKYHLPYSRDPEVKANNKTASDSKVAQMRETLFELGYISSHPHDIIIECKES